MLLLMFIIRLFDYFPKLKKPSQTIYVWVWNTVFKWTASNEALHGGASQKWGKASLLLFLVPNWRQMV